MHPRAQPLWEQTDTCYRLDNTAVSDEIRGPIFMAMSFSSWDPAAATASDRDLDVAQQEVERLQGQALPVKLVVARFTLLWGGL